MSDVFNQRALAVAILAGGITLFEFSGLGPAIRRRIAAWIGRPEPMGVTIVKYINPTIIQGDFGSDGPFRGEWFFSKFLLCPTTVDVVIFSYRPMADGALALHVLLITRGIEPFKGMHALTGGFINLIDNEDDWAAAAREAFEEVGIRFTRDQLRRVTCRANAERDPRGYTATHVFACTVDADVVARAGDDAASVIWVPVAECPALAFDHNELLEEAIPFADQMLQ